MAINNVPKSHKFDNIKHYLLVAEQVILYSVIVAGLGFYGGTRYSQAQAKHDAQIIKAALATPAPEVSKN